ncbi:MAG: cysteine--tRNA ligase [Myxococcales bacterium]|nr:cysteine--tRNA ligase [Myxococcales bacterium]
MAERVNTARAPVEVPVQLFNTRTLKKEIFEPSEDGNARIYTCGPTVYAAAHIGNLRSNLFADLLVRTLLHRGYSVTHVINVTDVGHLTDDADAGEDKMERAAVETGRTAMEIAEQYTQLWLDDRERLGCRLPDVLCRATEHIPEQIALVERLVERGFTYQIPDGVYFDTTKFPGYADFARLDLAGQASGARIADVEGKRHAADFALWKFAEEGVQRQQEWGSPWGRGFPGWHVECSAMSIQYLGETFDLHTGGVDHIKVHHTNEIAQSECAYGMRPWVRFWLHNEFVNLAGEKMAKSEGNVAVLQDLVRQGYPALVYRYFFLQAHYRQQQSFTRDAMDAAKTGYDRLVRAAAEVRDAGGEVREDAIEPLRVRFAESLADDLNAPRAVAVAWEVARGSELLPAERWELLREFDQVLRLDLANATPAGEGAENDPRVEALVAEREEARRTRDFATADRIRDELAAEGIVVKDTPNGPRWSRT